MTDERLVLPRVQIIMIGGVEPQLDAASMRDSCAKVCFGNGLYTQCDPGVEAYNETLWHKIPLLADKNVTHLLITQYDSWVLDPSLWRDSWLQYDYIGAPWPWHKENRVGNGGFSLRSVRLMKFLMEEKENFPVRHPEDDTLCRVYRSSLESFGFHWAPEIIARSFAFEREAPRPAFGFHGLFNFPHVLSPEACESRMSLAGEYAKSKPEWKELEQS